MEQKIRELLDQKGHDVVCVPPRTLVRDAVRSMNDLHIGSVLVMEERRLLGIFTERDVLRRIVEGRRDPDTTRVGDVMTRELVTVSPELESGRTMRVMTRQKVRHLPVVEHGRLIGLVSLGDLAWFVTQGLEEEVGDLTRYIYGPHATPLDLRP